MPRPDDQCSPGQTLSSNSGQSSERSNSRPFPAKGILNPQYKIMCYAMLLQAK